MRNRVRVGAFALVVLIGTVAATTIMWSGTGHEGRYLITTASPSGVATAPTRSSLQELYSRPSADFPVVDRVEVKKMRFGDVWPMAVSITGSHRAVTQAEANELVYTIARGGESRPEYATADRFNYRWDVIVVDAKDGTAFLHFGRPDGEEWPAMFTLLPDMPGE
jgi:hypothetical protein